jgi:hypothetical protein
VGSTAARWTVSTAPRVLSFFQGNGGDCTAAEVLSESSYRCVAIPLRTDVLDFASSATVTSHFLGVGLLTFGPGNGPKVPERIELRADGAGAPTGAVLWGGTPSGPYVGEGESATDGQGNALVGGVPAPSAAAVCALLIHAETGETGLCSGTVLSPHLLLTAAHCVSPGTVGKGASFSVSCAEHVPLDGGTVPGALEVAWVLPHPEFDPGALQGGADVGLVSTASLLPALQWELARAALPVDGGSVDVTLYGYGAAEPGESAVAGGRRQLQTTASVAEPKFLELAGGSTGACNGDSGGPVIVGGEIAGVISYGRSGCAGGVRAGAVAPVLDFLDAWRERDRPVPTVPLVVGPEAAAGGCASVPHAPAQWLPCLALLRRWKRTRRADGSHRGRRP